MQSSTHDYVDSDHLGKYYLEYLDSYHKLNDFKKQDEYRIQIQSKLAHYIDTLDLIQNMETRNAALMTQLKELKEFKRKQRRSTPIKAESLPSTAKQALKSTTQDQHDIDHITGSSSYLQKKCNQLTMQLNVIQNEKRNADKIANEYRSMYEKLKSTNNHDVDPFKKMISLSISPITTKTGTESPFRRPLPNYRGSKIPVASPTRKILSPSNLSLETSTPAINLSSATPNDILNEDDDMVIDSPSRNAPLTLKDHDLNMVTTSSSKEEPVVSEPSKIKEPKAKKVLKRKLRKVISDTPKRLKDDVYDDDDDDDDDDEDNNGTRVGNEDKAGDNSETRDGDNQVEEGNLAPNNGEQENKQASEEHVLTKKITAKKVKRNARHKSAPQNTFSFPSTEGSSTIMSPVKSRNNTLKRNIFK